ncbi:MAG: T9SS type A sorting domain-containing protein [Bacteroidales bacterium]|nr:T9SS type A sorting domain-containing protein [Bacteroidales bacterium]
MKKNLRRISLLMILTLLVTSVKISAQQKNDFYMRSGNGGWSQSNFSVCTQATRDLAVEFYYCTFYPGDLCDVGGFGQNPYEIKTEIYRDGVKIASKKYRTSKVWANFFFYDLTVVPGVYKAKVVAKKKKLFGWETIFNQYTNSITISKVTATPNFNINGSTTTPLDVNASNITVNAAATSCETKYHLHVMESNKWWSRTYDYEVKKWFNGQAPNGINLQQFATTYSYGSTYTGSPSRQGSPLIGGKLPNGNDRYYRVQIATAEPTWKTKTILIKVDGNAKSAEGITYHVADKKEMELSANKNIEFEVYPNPASNYINVDILSNEAKTVKITLMNTNGQIIMMNTNHELNEGPNSLNLNISDIPAGMYIMGVTSGGSQSIKKVVIR